MGTKPARAPKKIRKHRSFQELARFLTKLEQLDPASLRQLYTNQNESPTLLRLGITGPPGAGKSTLISGLIHYFRENNKKVGVIAVDPSSPFTKGSILGDRIRYQDHSTDASVFVRSVSSRGALGGLSSSVYLLSRAFSQMDFDVLLIETVGVGQTELEVMNVADSVAVVVVPEFGDSIQALKAGILEIADVFVVNKSDRPGSEAMAKELELWARDSDSKKAVIPTVATEQEGVKELAEALVLVAQQKLGDTSLVAHRLQAEAATILRMRAEQKIQVKVKAIHQLKDLLKIV